MNIETTQHPFVFFLVAGQAAFYIAGGDFQVTAFAAHQPFHLSDLRTNLLFFAFHFEGRLLAADHAGQVAEFEYFVAGIPEFFGQFLIGLFVGNPDFLPFTQQYLRLLGSNNDVVIFKRVFGLGQQFLLLHNAGVYPYLGFDSFGQIVFVVEELQEVAVGLVDLEKLLGWYFTNGCLLYTSRCV